ncbi:hypothetical protein FCV25MIE_05029 [Fagus crenata]
MESASSSSSSSSSSEQYRNWLEIPRDVTASTLQRLVHALQPRQDVPPRHRSQFRPVARYQPGVLPHRRPPQLYPLIAPFFERLLCF